MASSYWCETCRRIYAPQLIVDGTCPRGHSDRNSGWALRRDDQGIHRGRWSRGTLRGANAAPTAIHALWSQNERDQQFYQLLTPPVSLEQIRQTDGCTAPARCRRRLDRHRAATSPFAAASAYRLEYIAPERFVREMYALFDLTPPTDVDEHVTRQRSWSRLVSLRMPRYLELTGIQCVRDWQRRGHRRHGPYHWRDIRGRGDVAFRAPADACCLFVAYVPPGFRRHTEHHRLRRTMVPSETSAAAPMMLPAPISA